MIDTSRKNLLPSFRLVAAMKIRITSLSFALSFGILVSGGLMVFTEARPAENQRGKNPKSVSVRDLKDRHTASVFLQEMNARISEIAPKLRTDADSPLHFRHALKLWLEEAGYHDAKIQQATATEVTATREIMASRQLARLQEDQDAGSTRRHQNREGGRLDELRALSHIVGAGEANPEKRRTHLKKWLASREGQELSSLESALTREAEARRSRRTFALPPQDQNIASLPPLARAIAADSRALETTLSRPITPQERRELIRGLIATGEFVSEEKSQDSFQRRR